MYSLSESPIPKELIALEKTQVPKGTVTSKELWKHKREEKSTNYIYTREMWDRNEINIDIVFSLTIATEIANDFKLQTINECRQRHD